MKTAPPPAAAPPPRRWPAVVLVVLAAAGLLATWLAGALDRQSRVTATFAIVFVAAFLLLVWLALFSRLPVARRLAWLAGAAGVALVAVGLLRVEGVTGDLVPVLGWRFAGPPDAGGHGAGGTAGAVAASHDWPRYLGPHGDGSVPGVALDPDWAARPPRQLWRRPVGAGWASFAVVGDAAVTQEQRGDDEAVVRYDLASGREVWVDRAPARYAHPISGEGPRATPAIADGRVYTMGATGILTCLDLGTGARRWRRDVYGEAGAAIPEWGVATSPVLVGDLVVVPGPRGVVAYDRDDGEVTWTAGDDEPAYATVVQTELAGVPQLVVFHRAAVAGYRPMGGDPLWRVPWERDQPNVAQPLVIGPDRLLVSSGYGIGARLFALSRDGDGLAAAELWRSPRLKAKFASPVLHEGTIYGLDDGVLVCLDPATGERCWKRGRYGHGQVVATRDHLLIQAEDGDVVLVEARPDEHREVAHLAALDDKTWNVPTVAGRHLLVRNHREAACYELPLRGAGAEPDGRSLEEG